MLEKEYRETIVKLLSKPDYVKLSFYGFILAKLEVKFDPEFPTLGVRFDEGILNYELTIGDYFLSLSEAEKIAVLIHECQHIINLHTSRREDRDHELYNIAADIAINQMIDNLPEDALYPETFNFPENLNAEQYYELLVQEKEKQKKKQQEDPVGLLGSPNLLDQSENTIDVHDWEEENNENIKELQRSVTEQLVKEAIYSSKGNVPSNIENILNILKGKAKVSWKKELKKIISSRRGGKTETFKKRNRRFPHRKDLRGNKISRDKPTIIVGIDTSGSMEDEDILKGLIEINEVIKNIGELKIIQIDTTIKGVETFDKNKFKKIKRIGYGGTYMGECPRYIMDNNLQCDALVMISDMYIENVSTDSNWRKFKKPVIWLTTSGSKVSVLKNHKIFDIHKH